MEGRAMKQAFLGYQLYSAREDAAQDLRGTLRRLREVCTGEAANLAAEAEDTVETLIVRG